MAVFFALFVRASAKDKEAAEYLDDTDLDLGDDEEHLHSLQVRMPLTHRQSFNLCLLQNGSPFDRRSVSAADRLSEGEIAQARDLRLKQLQMRSILREIITYFTLLFLASVVVYASVNPSAFSQVKHFRQFFLNTRKNDRDFTQVRHHHLLLSLRSTRCFRSLAHSIEGFLELAGRLIPDEHSRTAVVQRRSSSQSEWLPQRPIDPIDRMGDDEATSSERSLVPCPRWSGTKMLR